MRDHAVVDIFCGAGGLTHGLIRAGFNVVAGLDSDETCRYPYERNNPGAKFISKKIEDVDASEIASLYPKNSIRILVGCAPCQPFSRYTKRNADPTSKWRLISKFVDLICQVDPDIVSMENVPTLVTYQNGIVYREFVDRLKDHNYRVSEYKNVFCPDYGVPQSRTRLVLFASKFSEIKLLPATHFPDKYKTVEATIGDMEPLRAGDASSRDPLHRASALSELNIRRIKASKQGGTWRDWNDSLLPPCFKKESGKGYASVYGRMSWKDLSPTITTQCHGYGNGRFGHPEQDRAISLREAALLQTFPPDYEFVEPGKPSTLSRIGRHIGNAVPVELATIIGESIRLHLDSNDS